YTNLIRRHFKNTRPIVLGGMEASLRRISHYDFKTNKVRRSILFDARADVLVYGMGEKTVTELARRLQSGEDFTDLRGICYAAAKKPEGFLELPAHSKAAADKEAFIEMFAGFYKNTDPVRARGLCQLQDTRYLVCNPPQLPLSQQEIDPIHELDYRRRAHPVHADQGRVRALDTIAFSIISHRGCYGECHFCAITALQGKTVISRSRQSILREAESLARHPDFKGVISDVGGPTANMYEIECRKKATHGACIRKRCLGGRVCPELAVDHGPQIRLLKDLRKIAGIKHVFIGSGIRHDLILADSKNGQAYLEQIIGHHVSGQHKIAPEHSENHLLTLMGKPDIDLTRQFIRRFRKTAARLGKKYYGRLPGMHAKGYGSIKRLLQPGNGLCPGTGPDLHPGSGHRGHAHVLDKKNMAGQKPPFRGNRPPPQTGPETNCHATGPACKAQQIQITMDLMSVYQTISLPSIPVIFRNRRCN
ncbi:MAG: hypothetical protein ACOC1H_04285, partial [Desulfosalsimonas sp.]